jgi:hypothetical protein
LTSDTAPLAWKSGLITRALIAKWTPCAN